MLNVVPVTTNKQKRQFVDFQFQLYQNEKNWVPPLKMERHEFLNPQKNPFFQNAEVKLFLALDEDKPVGRISAHINRLHNERYGEKTGHFGFFDCENREDAARALFEAAETWLKEQGMTQIVGPFNFSTNEECGLLLEGFNHKPYPYMPYNFPYYETLVSALGYRKIKDLIAWSYDALKPVPEMAEQVADMTRQYPGLVIREVSKKNMSRDVEIIRDIFNSAWSQNWGFVPWTDAEIAKMAKDFKLILEPKLALIAEVDGVPAAISIAIPNYHEAIADLNGKLFPFGIFKLLYRLKIKKVKTARLCLLGIKKEFRRDVLKGLSVLLYTEMHRRGLEVGCIGGELSWTLDDNDKINQGIALMGGTPYKKYRLFEKKI